MQLKIYQNNGEVLMHLEGNLDGSGACQVELALKRLQEKTRNRKLIFDLRGIRNFEYFGIAIFAKSIRGQKRHFQEVSVTGLQASTESIFRRFGVENDKIARALV